MKVKRGDTICSDFGCGPIIAITKEWVIFESEGNEYAISRTDDIMWVPAEFETKDIPDNEMDMEDK